MTYEHHELCAECGGKCCKQMPGEMSPGDVMRHFCCNSLLAAVTSALVSGRFAVDWWEGDPRTGCDELGRGYYIRARAKTDTGLMCPSWGGRCTFLRDDGCELPPDLRPLTCRLLEPKEGDACELHNGGGKNAAALLWLPHHDLILRAVRVAEDARDLSL